MPKDSRKGSQCNFFQSDENEMKSESVSRTPHSLPSRALAKNGKPNEHIMQTLKPLGKFALESSKQLVKYSQENTAGGGFSRCNQLGPHVAERRSLGELYV